MLFPLLFIVGFLRYVGRESVLRGAPGFNLPFDFFGGSKFDAANGNPKSLILLINYSS